MHAVMSMWSKPLIDRLRNYSIYPETGEACMSHFIGMCYSWILSNYLLNCHYKDVRLVTDAYGKRFLVDTLELPFSDVAIVLDGLDVPPYLFAFGKVIAYSMQEKPFVHVDNDVFLWDKIPNECANADVFAQSEEVISSGEYPYYNIDVCEKKADFIPREWKRYTKRKRKKDMLGYNAGIIGGTKIDFFPFYKDMVFEFMHRNMGSTYFSNIHITVFEQFMISVAAHAMGIRIKTLLNGKNGWSGLYPQSYSANYTHLIRAAKDKPANVLRMKQILETLCPGRIRRYKSVEHLKMIEVMG